jgi:hypothetical protein
MSDARLRRLDAKRRTLRPTAEEVEARHETAFRGIRITFVHENFDINEALGMPVVFGDLGAIAAAREAVRCTGIGVAYCDYSHPETLQPLPPELRSNAEERQGHHGDGV